MACRSRSTSPEDGENDWAPSPRETFSSPSRTQGRLDRKRIGHTLRIQTPRGHRGRRNRVPSGGPRGERTVRGGQGGRKIQARSRGLGSGLLEERPGAPGEVLECEAPEPAAHGGELARGGAVEAAAHRGDGAARA